MMFGWLKKQTEKEQPNWLKSYLGLDFATYTTSGIDDAQFVALDCETTGLGKADEVITIGALTCTSKEIFVSPVLDIKFDVPSIGASSEIHGELSSGASQIEGDHLEPVIEFLSNAIIVGHNIRFDVAKIDQLLKGKYHTSLKNKVLDTADLAIKLDPISYERSVGGRSRLSLDDLCNQFSIKIENRHTALGDAYITAQLMQKLLQRLKIRGCKEMKQLPVK